jgi:hypothetical protein
MNRIERLPKNRVMNISDLTSKHEKEETPKKRKNKIREQDEN